jgi:hypothetical protein
MVRRDHVRRNVVRGGDPHLAGYAEVATECLTLERKNGFLRSFGLRADTFSAVGENVSGLPALEEPGAEPFLQRIDAARRRRSADLQASRPGNEAAGAGDRQKYLTSSHSMVLQIWRIDRQ